MRILILSLLGVLGVGCLPATMLMDGVLGGQGYDQLLIIHAAVVKDREHLTETQAKDMIHQIDVIAKSVKGGASGSAKRDVARMANYLKEMVRSAKKSTPQPTEVPAPVQGAAPEAAAAADEGPADEGTDPFSRANTHFEAYSKAAAKKLGKIR